MEGIITLKQSSILFLKAAIIVITLIVLAICTNTIPRIIATFQPGGYDPILIGLYIPAIPFFIALYKSYQLLKNIERNQAFSSSSVSHFRQIKYSALSISCLFLLGMPYIFYVADKDDAPGVIVIALVIIFASFTIATFSGVLQTLVQTAVNIKSEHDLTV